MLPLIISSVCKCFLRRVYCGTLSCYACSSWQCSTTISTMSVCASSTQSAVLRFVNYPCKFIFYSRSDASILTCSQKWNLSYCLVHCFLFMYLKYLYKTLSRDLTWNFYCSFSYKKEFFNSHRSGMYGKVYANLEYLSGS